jgi:predicted GNAT family acetyltransferase
LTVTTIRILQPGDEVALEAFLLPRIETSMFLLGNSRAAGLRDHGERFQGTYAAAFEGNRITGVVAHFSNDNLITQAESSLNDLVRVAVWASGRGVKQVIGPATQVAVVLADLAIEPAQVQMDSVESLYRLALPDLIVPEALATGRVTARRAIMDDLEQLARWRVAYRVEAMNEPESPQLLDASRKTAPAQIRERRLWLAFDGDQPVAMTGFNAVTGGAVQVGGVFTPVALRGRGYARAAVAQSLLDVRDEGAQIAILFTGDDNLAAQRAYTALGFRLAGDYRITILKDAIETL